MRESPDELRELDDLLGRSRAGATSHLRDIINDDRALDAHDVVRVLVGMKVLALATVTGRSEPRVSAVDGHFLHGQWVFTTDGSSAKARQLDRRPAVSAAHIDHETFAVFTHGHALRLTERDERYGETLQYLVDHYGSSPLSWGDDIRLYRVAPSWMVGYAFDRARLSPE
jgi:hypothetical protein